MNFEACNGFSPVCTASLLAEPMYGNAWNVDLCKSNFTTGGLKRGGLYRMTKPVGRSKLI